MTYTQFCNYLKSHRAVSLLCRVLADIPTCIKQTLTVPGLSFELYPR